MKRKLLLATALFSLAGCGGTISVGWPGGYYALSVRLSEADLISPTVVVGQTEVAIPPDQISGTVNLVYSGAGTGMRGVVQSAELCLQDGCYSLPVSGVILPNGSLNFSVRLVSHKFSFPWIEVNPFEDVVISTTTRTDRVATEASVQTSTFQYANVPLNLSLIPLVVAGQVVVQTRDGGTYRGQVVQNGYIADTHVSLTLDKGITATNEYVLARVYVDNSLACRYDYGSGRTTNYGNFTCTYNPTPTGVELSVSGFEGSRTLRVEYDFKGVLRCQDDGRGSFTQDCSGGSVDYVAGAIRGLTFKFTALNVPQEGQVKYLSGGFGSNKVTYVLPPSSVQGHVRTVVGRVVEVINGANGAVLCSNQGNSTGCSLDVFGGVATITFQRVPDFPVVIRYTVDQKVDFNPSIDLTYVPKLPTATVFGQVRVRVRLESGETLSATTPISFRVVPR